MIIKKKKIEELKPADYNPRIDLQPGDEEYEKLKSSIKEFGYVEPITWNKQTGNIVGGHQRLKVLKDLGETEVDVVVIDIDETKEKALNIALNKISGDWDHIKLEDLMAELEELDFDLSLTGFDDNFFAEEYEALEDNYEIELPPIPDAKPGDVYQLGRHRLMCGDATSAEDVARLMEGTLADLIVTDPPYNVDYVGKTKDALTIQNDQMEDSSFREFLVDAFAQINKYLKPGGAFYIWHADSEGYNFRGACRDVGWEVRQCLIWNKNFMVMGRQDYHWKHEPCLYGWKEGAAHYFIDDRTQTTVHEDFKPKYRQMKKAELIELLDDLYSDKVSTTIINEDRPSVSAEHPTMKPIKLLARLIKNSSKPGEVVQDLFAGSGSTLMTCEQLNRTNYSMELDPQYVDVIIDRWEKFTGEKAVKL